MIRTFITAAAFATFTIAGAAQATTATVQTKDLDLATAEGQAKLEARLDRAARNVCSEMTTSSRIRVVDSECVARARAGIEKQVAARRAGSSNGG
ncbi:UrcA family protein [Novosphingobium sp. Gsoil 351]|uniref:UrcA family protein n=1 Tax=Novosphingobium sp. Gsoil 351 TaxID=2675225 RepID=UPI0012B4C87A|nr:UrcA family protein [Novosphingobium sp. Gsoil 351]QGN55101.1 UrcA family protein [Novosphingobium sp. Gsoil 351]